MTTTKTASSVAYLKAQVAAAILCCGPEADWDDTTILEELENTIRDTYPSEDFTVELNALETARDAWCHANPD
jgi:hypothetical protein